MRSIPLLDFARHEEAEPPGANLHSRSRIEQAIAHQKIPLRRAIRFLEDPLQQNDDAALRLLLEQAVTGRESLRMQVECCIEDSPPG